MLSDCSGATLDQPLLDQRVNAYDLGFRSEGFLLPRVSLFNLQRDVFQPEIVGPGVDSWRRIP